MEITPDNITFNFGPQVFWGVVVLLTFAGIVQLTLFLATRLSPENNWLLRQKSGLGLGDLSSVLFILGGLLWIAVFLLLTLGLIWLIWDVIWISIPDSAGNKNAIWDWRFSLAKLTALVATLGAVVALPVTLQRLRLTQRQTKATEEGLITDRITNAITGLGAEKTVKKQRNDQKGNPTYGKKPDGKNDYSQPVMIEVTEPNLEVRIGAIYALERIAQDSDRDHVQIMEIICSYIRNNAPAQSARKSPHEVRRQLKRGDEVSRPLNDEEIFQHPRYIAANTIGVTPDELDDQNLNRWSRALAMPRDDIQVALRVLGRRWHLKKESQSDYRLDLRNTNLQRSQLAGEFGKAHFSDSRLDGSKLSGNFTECDFTHCSLQAISCQSIECQKSNFGGANLSSAKCVWAQFSGSVFWFALLDHTSFNGSTMRACDFYGCIPNYVFFFGTADASYSRFSNTHLNEFKGIEEGNSKGLWYNGENGHLLLPRERFQVLRTATVAELDEKLEWLSYLNELGLTSAHQDCIN